MEENKKQQKSKKLSYEELENAAKQISAQLDSMARENAQLRELIKKEQFGNMLAELEFRFKVLNYSNLFSEVFVKNCVAIIEDVLTPPKENEDKKEE